MQNDYNKQKIVWNSPSLSSIIQPLKLHDKKHDSNADEFVHKQVAQMKSIWRKGKK